MKRILPFVKLCLVLVLAVSLYVMARSWWERQESVSSYQKAAELAHLSPAAVQPAGVAGSSLPESSRAAELAQIDLAALREVNPDVVGWIEIPGTEISYPLLQGTDNQFYLTHTWDKGKNPSGSIYLDYKSDPSLDGFHTIVYGHRMDNNTMFGMLKDYKNQDFWQEHPNICLVTGDGVFLYNIFSAREASTQGLVYRLDLVKGRKEEDFIQDCVENSVIDTGVVPDSSDRILTLSTCVNLGYSNNRWVVHAVLCEN